MFFRKFPFVALGIALCLHFLALFCSTLCRRQGRHGAKPDKGTLETHFLIDIQQEQTSRNAVPAEHPQNGLHIQ